jgi:hypothetical protein
MYITAGKDFTNTALEAKSPYRRRLFSTDIDTLVLLYGARPIPKVVDNDALHGSGSGRPGRRDARASGERRNARQSNSGRPEAPHPQGRAILTASRVVRCPACAKPELRPAGQSPSGDGPFGEGRLLYPHNGAARALLAVKIVPVK